MPVFPAWVAIASTTPGTLSSTVKGGASTAHVRSYPTGRDDDETPSLPGMPRREGPHHLIERRLVRPAPSLSGRSGAQKQKNGPQEQRNARHPVCAYCAPKSNVADRKIDLWRVVTRLRGDFISVLGVFC